jgi:hypothetical protein
MSLKFHGRLYQSRNMAMLRTPLSMILLFRFLHQNTEVHDQLQMVRI